jgi:hypothetical protein
MHEGVFIKTIYWAFDEKGKISEEQYREAKATKKTPRNLCLTDRKIVF